MAEPRADLQSCEDQIELLVDAGKVPTNGAAPFACRQQQGSSVDRGALPRGVLLALYAGGVYAAFLVHDYLQELLWHLPEFRFPQFMTLFEFASCAVFSLAEIWFRRIRMSGVSPVRYALLSGLILPSMVMATSALQYISYPIKVVAKSTKLLPTMAVGSLLLGRRFNAWHYLAALCLCGGLAGFVFSDAKHSPSGNATTILGLALLGGSVFLDAFTPNVQQKLLGNYKGSETRASEAEVMMYTNLFGFVVLVPSSIITGELWEALAFVKTNPSALMLLTVFATTTYLGVSAYLRLISNFSGVTATVVTTSRKVVTIVLSFLFFPKVAVWAHAASGVVVLLGIVCNELARRSESAARAERVAPQDLVPAPAPRAAAAIAQTAGTPTEQHQQLPWVQI